MKAYLERRYAAGDGKSLYYREYGDPLAETIPMLCLPGLSRNSRDFQELAMRHAPKRRVICPDYRGRGRSDYDQDPKNYHPKKLLDDIRHLLVAANLHHFVVIGTSMGGILAIALSALIPSAVRGIVLNDIGPDIGGAGLGRVLRYLGKDNPQSDWETATAALKEMLPGLSFRTAEEWRAVTEGTFREGEDGVLHIDWDPLIVEPMRTRADSAELWTLFQAIRAKPALAFRGENSDILSEATMSKMTARHTRLTAVTVAGAGHTPSLLEDEATSAIDTFLREF
ncbi:MAG: alpha/beta hydrolase [Pseudomonadota bacterium]|nr:alpha/beta hydrolase [Pseudomonadota bacterium]MEE3094852.1 alpha/beta hydrolase [Pseudomonadota bacterium]